MTLNFVTTARDGLVICTDTRIGWPDNYRDDHRKVHQITERFGYTFSGYRSFGRPHTDNAELYARFDPCRTVHVFSLHYRGLLPDPEYFHGLARTMVFNFNKWAVMVPPNTAPPLEYDSGFEMVFFHFTDPDYVLLLRLKFGYDDLAAPELWAQFEGGVVPFKGTPHLKGTGDLWFKDALQSRNPKFEKLRRDPLYQKFFLRTPPDIHAIDTAETVTVLKQMIAHTSKYSPRRCVSENCDVVFLDRHKGWQWLEKITLKPDYS